MVLTVMVLELLLAAKDLAITLGTWMEIGFLAYAEIGEVEVRRVGRVDVLDEGCS